MLPITPFPIGMPEDSHFPTKHLIYAAPSAQSQTAAALPWNFCQKPYQSGIERTRIGTPGRFEVRRERVA